ncbi:MAG: hypothetical protein ACRBK7_04200 [Acidimicrobiales bacterium]
MSQVVSEVSSQATVESAEVRALQRISVRRPYFDLREMEELGDGIVSAVVPGAEPSDPEVGAIEAAQVARHLAILGSCAAALSRDDDAQHHYLATRAHYTRLANAPTELGGSLRAEAIASWVDRRTARALVKLSSSAGQGLNLLDVEYTVLTPKMFKRFNPPIDQDTLDLAKEPGVAQVEPTEIPDGVSVDCGLVTAELCAGHFPDYPAAPVAIVMGRLCGAAGLAMNRHLGTPDGRYRIEEGNVSASGLARAGQRLVLEARYVKPVRCGHQLTGVALADGEVVGEVTVTMSAHAAAPVDFSC